MRKNNSDSTKFLPLVLFIILSLALFPVFPASNHAWANSPAEVLIQNQPLQPAAPELAVDPSSGNVLESGKPALPDDSLSFLSSNPLSVSPQSRAPSASSDPVPNEDRTLSNDPFYGTSGTWGNSYDDLWWLKRVNADDAWTFTRGEGATVAVIDTGIDYWHEDIAGNIWQNESEWNGFTGFDDDGNGLTDDLIGWNFYNGYNNPLDDHGHGTHVAGIIGAVADNLRGIAGIAPGSKIIPIKVLNSSGSGYIQDVIKGIRYAADLGADVINLSLGIYKSGLPKSLYNSLRDAIRYAYNKGSILVAAAGNDNRKVANTLPAAFKEVISVGAIEPLTDNRAWFSNFGPELDFVAPGVDILSLRAWGTGFGSNSYADPDYSRASGTSMASPMVAGVVALLRSQNPNITFNEVVSVLKSTSLDLGKAGFDYYYGYGLIDAYKALSLGSVNSLQTSSSSTTSSSSSGSVSIPGWPRGHSANFSSLSSYIFRNGVNPGSVMVQGYSFTHYAIDAFSSGSDSSKRRRGRK